MHDFHHLQHLFARKRFSSSLRRKNSKSSLQTPSDQLPREVKSAQYCTVEYKIDLEEKGSYMREFDDNDIPKDIKTFCKNLLETTQTLSQDSLFRDSVTVGSGFNPIGLTRPTLTLGSGKFPSPTGWGGRRMRAECPTRPTRSCDVT